MTAYHSSSSVFMTNSSSVTGLNCLVRLPSCEKVMGWCSGLHKTASFYTEQCISSSLCHNFEVSQGGSNQLLKNYGFICYTIFFTCTHVHKALSNVIVTRECWITNYG